MCSWPGNIWKIVWFCCADEETTYAGSMELSICDRYTLVSWLVPSIQLISFSRIACSWKRSRPLQSGALWSNSVLKLNFEHWKLGFSQLASLAWGGDLLPRWRTSNLHRRDPSVSKFLVWNLNGIIFRYLKPFLSRYKNWRQFLSGGSF